MRWCEVIAHNRHVFIRLEGLLYDAERELLAIAAGKHLVDTCEAHFATGFNSKH